MNELYKKIRKKFDMCSLITELEVSILFGSLLLFLLCVTA